MNYWIAVAILAIVERVSLLGFQRSQILICIVQMQLSFLLRHFIKGFDEHAQPWILQKEITVNMHKTPKQCIPNDLPIPFGIVTHFHQVIAATDIGFCRHQTTVCKTLYQWQQLPDENE